MNNDKKRLKLGTVQKMNSEEGKKHCHALKAKV